METPPEERGMVAVKALQALKAAPPGRAQQIAELGAREFGSGVRAYRREQPRQIGSEKHLWTPGGPGEPDVVHKRETTTNIYE